VANQDMLADYDAKNPPAFSRLIAGGTKLRRFSDEIMQAARRDAFAIMEEDAARDPAYRKVYSAWKAYRDESFNWFGASERAYTEFAIDAIG